MSRLMSWFRGDSSEADKNTPTTPHKDPSKHTRDDESNPPLQQDTPSDAIDINAIDEELNAEKTAISQAPDDPSSNGPKKPLFKGLNFKAKTTTTKQPINSTTNKSTFIAKKPNDYHPPIVSAEQSTPSNHSNTTYDAHHNDNNAPISHIDDLDSHHNNDEIISSPYHSSQDTHTAPHDKSTPKVKNDFMSRLKKNKPSAAQETSTLPQSSSTSSFTKQGSFQRESSSMNPYATSTPHDNDDNIPNPYSAVTKQDDDNDDDDDDSTLAGFLHATDENDTTTQSNHNVNTTTTNTSSLSLDGHIEQLSNHLLSSTQKWEKQYKSLTSLQLQFIQLSYDLLYNIKQNETIQNELDNAVSNDDYTTASLLSKQINTIKSDISILENNIITLQSNIDTIQNPFLDEVYNILRNIDIKHDNSTDTININNLSSSDDNTILLKSLHQYAEKYYNKSCDNNKILSSYDINNDTIQDKVLYNDLEVLFRTFPFLIEQHKTSFQQYISSEQKSLDILHTYFNTQKDKYNLVSELLEIQCQNYKDKLDSIDKEVNIQCNDLINEKDQLIVSIEEIDNDIDILENKLYAARQLKREKEDQLETIQNTINNVNQHFINEKQDIIKNIEYNYTLIQDTSTLLVLCDGSIEQIQQHIHDNMYILQLQYNNDINRYNIINSIINEYLIRFNILSYILITYNNNKYITYNTILLDIFKNIKSIDNIIIQNENILALEQENEANITRQINDISQQIPILTLERKQCVTSKQFDKAALITTQINELNTLHEQYKLDLVNIQHKSISINELLQHDKLKQCTYSQELITHITSSNDGAITDNTTTTTNNNTQYILSTDIYDTLSIYLSQSMESLKLLSQLTNISTSSSSSLSSNNNNIYKIHRNTLPQSITQRSFSLLDHIQSNTDNNNNEDNNITLYLQEYYTTLLDNTNNNNDAATTTEQSSPSSQPSQKITASLLEQYLSLPLPQYKNTTHHNDNNTIILINDRLCNINTLYSIVSLLENECTLLQTLLQQNKTSSSSSEVSSLPSPSEAVAVATVPETAVTDEADENGQDKHIDTLEEDKLQGVDTTTLIETEIDQEEQHEEQQEIVNNTEDECDNDDDSLAFLNANDDNNAVDDSHNNNDNNNNDDNNNTLAFLQDNDQQTETDENQQAEVVTDHQEQDHQNEDEQDGDDLAFLHDGDEDQTDNQEITQYDNDIVEEHIPSSHQPPVTVIAPFVSNHTDGNDHAIAENEAKPEADNGNGNGNDEHALDFLNDDDGNNNDEDSAALDFLNEHETNNELENPIIEAPLDVQPEGDDNALDFLNDDNDEANHTDDVEVEEEQQPETYQVQDDSENDNSLAFLNESDDDESHVPVDINNDGDDNSSNTNDDNALAFLDQDEQQQEEEQREEEDDSLAFLDESNDVDVDNTITNDDDSLAFLNETNDDGHHVVEEEQEEHAIVDNGDDSLAFLNETNDTDVVVENTDINNNSNDADGDDNTLSFLNDDDDHDTPLPLPANEENPLSFLNDDTTPNDNHPSSNDNDNNTDIPHNEYDPSNPTPTISSTLAMDFDLLGSFDAPTTTETAAAAAATTIAIPPSISLDPLDDFLLNNDITSSTHQSDNNNTTTPLSNSGDNIFDFLSN